MGQEPTITLSIKEAGEHPNSTYLFHILLNGNPITCNQSLSLPESQTVRELSRCFGSLFEQKCMPVKEADAQRALGRQLFNHWLASSWEKIRAAVPVGSLRFLVIASEVPEILNLPWELLHPPDSDFLGIDPLFRIRRFPSTARQMAPFTGELRPRPLRLLFMACSPLDLQELDYEKEEESLFRAVYGQDVAFDSCDLGTFKELKEKVSEFQPHIVHLTGHGAVIDGKGHFAFEKEDGTADLVPSEDLRRFLAGSGVQCVFVSGCQSGKAPREALAGICQALVGAEVPLAVGWAASIADDLATNFARTFYKTLKDGQPVDRAFLLARQEAWKACQERVDPSWTLPVIYSSTNQVQIFDPKKSPETLNRRNEILEALPGMKEGYAEHFVGRRREQQRLLPALRSGDLQVVIITGMGGSGKSTLATRLARKLENYGFIPIPVSSSKENPLNSARLLQAFGDAFRKASRETKTVNVSKADELATLAEDLNNPRLSVQSRLRDAVAALNEGRFLLLLDNFESNIDEVDRHIQDPELSEFYRHLLDYLSGSSRAIITTRYPPSDVPVLPSKVHKEDLGDFPESFFLKIMQRDPEVERRIRSGELPMPLMTELHKKFGGTPRFLIQMREAIKMMDAELLEAELAKVELPTVTERGELEKLRDKYFADIFTERLYGYLSPESQKALCLSAVYSVPVTLEGLAAVAGEPLGRVQALARSWQDRAFAYQETGKSNEPLWIVYGLLRGWLLAKLSPNEKKDAHKAAGNFLVEMDALNQGDELGLSSIICVLEARSHYLSAEKIELARGLTMRLSGSLIRGGFYNEVRQLNAEQLSYEEHPSSMIWIANAFSYQGKYDYASQWYQFALRAAGDSNLKEIAASWHGLATIDLMKFDYDSAYEKFQKSLEIDKVIGDRVGEASTLHNLATIELKKGNYEFAREKFEAILKIRQEIDDHLGESSALYALATIDLNNGDYEIAREKFEMVIKIRQNEGDRSGESSTWHQLATIDMRTGDYDSALEEFKRSMQISSQIGDKNGVALALNSIASIDQYKGDLDSAKDNFEKALRIVKPIGDLACEASILNNLATIDLNNGNCDLAREKLEKAMKIVQQIGDRVGEATILNSLAAIDADKGDRVLAREKFEKAKTIMQQIGNRGGEASMLINLAEIDQIEQKQYAALEKYRNALKIMHQIGDRAGAATAFIQLGILAWDQGRKHEGLHLVALCCFLVASIGHGDATHYIEVLSSMALELGCTQERIGILLKEVARAYRIDDGRSLLNKAFPKG
jgi:tetratricopeptide (TPR) repeat protein